MASEKCAGKFFLPGRVPGRVPGTGKETRRERREQQQRTPCRARNRRSATISRAMKAVQTQAMKIVGSPKGVRKKIDKRLNFKEHLKHRTGTLCPRSHSHSFLSMRSCSRVFFARFFTPFDEKWVAIGFLGRKTKTRNPPGKGQTLSSTGGGTTASGKAHQSFP